MSVMFCTGATFVRKNSCLVAKIVSFDTVKSWNSIFLNSEMFSFNSYVYYLTRGFITSTRAFNLATRVFSLLTCRFELVTHGFELATREFELVTRGFELVTCGFELVTRGFELVTRNSCFTFPHLLRISIKTVL